MEEEGDLSQFFCLGMSHWRLRTPYLFIVCAVSNYGTHVSHFCQYGNNFLTANLPILKSLFTKNFSAKILKMCDPILVTQLKEKPHYSQSNRKNVTLSNMISLLACF